MSNSKDIKLKLEREDTPTHSIWKRWKYEILVKHLKKTIIITISFIVAFVVCFFITWAIMGLDKWAYGFIGIFIFLFYIIKWIGLGLWFLISKAFFAYLFAPLIYLIIKQFIHVDKVAFRELGSQNTYFFKITTVQDGYLLHEDKFFGLRKKPIYLDKTTVQYFKEHGAERVFKEKGKKDNAFLEIDIVPLSFRGDTLLITDTETNKRFFNNRILVKQEIRDLYEMTIKGLTPLNQDLERTIIYETILGYNDVKNELMQAKYQLKNIHVEKLEPILDIALPSKSQEFLRYKRVLDKTTEPYERIADFKDLKREMKELSLAESPEELEELLMYYVAEEEN